MLENILSPQDFSRPVRVAWNFRSLGDFIYPHYCKAIYMLMTFKFYLRLSFWLIRSTFDFLPLLAPPRVFLISEKRILGTEDQPTNLVCPQLLPFLDPLPSIYQQMIATFLPCHHDTPLLLNQFPMAAMTKLISWVALYTSHKSPKSRGQQNHGPSVMHRREHFLALS